MSDQSRLSPSCPFCASPAEPSYDGAGTRCSSRACYLYGCGEGVLTETWISRPIESALRAERDEARRFGEDAAAKYNALIAQGPTLTCAFCGEAYADGTPPTRHERLTAHVMACTKHPLRAEITRLKAELAAKPATVAHRDGIADRVHELETWCWQFSGRIVALEAALRAALARGPQGKADVPVERVATCAFCDATRCNWETAQRNADEWKSRALAAEAKVKELEARLTDAALVEAGWVPMKVATVFLSEALVRERVALWLSRNAQQAKGGS